MTPAASSKTASWTVLAHLLRPQGRKGEVLAELCTDFPERFGERELFLAPESFVGLAEEARPVTVTGHWLPVGRNHGRVVLAIAGIDSIELAESLAGLKVIVPDSSRVELPKGEEYIDDLIGCTVFDLAGSEPTQPIGSVIAVDFPTTPNGSRRLESAAPLLTVLTPAGDEVMIPYVESFLVSLSTEAKRIEMKLPVGLLDLNR